MGLTSGEDKAVRINGVPKLGWKTNTQCCFVGALSAALAGSDHPVSERELNGLTALAFRTRWLYYDDKPKWCPSCPVGECHEEIAAVTRNTGWRLDGAMDWSIEERRQQIVASIDRGVPALVYDTRWNPAVAYGYAEAGAQVVVSDYFGGDGPHGLSDLPPFVAIVQAFTSAPDRTSAVADALRTAVTNWHTDHKFNGAAVYWYGKAAFDHWMHDVLAAQDGPDGTLFFPNWWNMDVLVDARLQASLWLTDVAPLFDRSAEDHLRVASSFYQQEHQMLWQAWDVDNAFDGDPEKWKRPEHARRIVEVLAQARDLEAQAIVEIEHAQSL